MEWTLVPRGMHVQTAKTCGLQLADTVECFSTTDLVVRGSYMHLILCIWLSLEVAWHQ